MLTIPNLISMIRIPLVFVFLSQNLFARIVAILLASVSDFFDGYLARKFDQTSRFGTVLDPIADKFFVIVVLCVFIKEGKISYPELCAMLCRDFSVILFGVYLILTKNFGRYHFRSIWSGKISTALQLCVLMALTCNVTIPTYLYSIFVALGVAALVELYLSDHSFIPTELRKNKS
ncbi:MAG: CDP-alcohol phosphatidyltransferase family protein [Chlamydiota bacterium]|nr:CDP-alcohol phosphatidyltransferase family protein [Chlamydiota bacterium]